MDWLGGDQVHAQHPVLIILAGSNIIAAIAALFFAVFAGYGVLRRLEVAQQRDAFKLKHGCQPPASVLPGFDPFSLVFMKRIVTAARKHSLLSFFQILFRKHGSTVVKNSLTRTSIFTMDAENVKCALSTRFDDWAIKEQRQKGYKWLLGDGIFTTDGAFWAHSRAMLRPAFEKSQVADLSHFENHIGPLLKHIPKDGQTVDLQEIFFKFSMDTSSELLLGESTKSLSSSLGDETQRFARDLDYAMEDGMYRSRLGLLYFLVPHPKAQKAITFCKSFVQGYVERAIKAEADLPIEKPVGKGRFVFLEELAKHEIVDAVRLRDEALNVLMAGRDTTASLLSNLWFMLARHPDVFQKLQKEVDELHGELPTYERLRGMKYLKYCAQESLRLMPPVPLLTKLAIRDTVLKRGGGLDGSKPLFVAKGTALFYDTRQTMRQTSIYGPDAESFRPDRWADDSLRPGWNYLPFGGGPRVCLGQQYALTECYYVTIRLMQHFRNVLNRDGEPWTEKLSATCCSLNGTQVALTP